MTWFVFEDHENSLIARLFRFSYGNSEISKSFIYSKGSAKLPDLVEELLQNENDRVSVYFDAVPGNRDIVSTYYKLRNLVYDYHYRLYIIPVVCSEYYALKSFLGKNIISNEELVIKRVNKEPHYFEKIEGAAKCKTIENYCKLLIEKNVRPCASTSTILAEELYSVYYNLDCKCRYADDTCVDRSLLEKSLALLQQYPCIPKNEELVSKRGSICSMALIHRKLIDDFNLVSERYKEFCIEHNICQDLKFARLAPIDYEASLGE